MVKVTHKNIDDVKVIYLEGELRLNNISAFKSAVIPILKESNFRGLIINLASVPMVDSSGVAFLFSLVQEKEAKGDYKICLSSVNQTSLEIFKITRLTQKIPICANDQEALRSM